MESEIIEDIDNNIRSEQDKMEMCLELLNEEDNQNIRAKILNKWFICRKNVDELIEEKRMFDYYR